MKKFRLIILIIAIHSIISCESKYQVLNLIGTWQFHDKDSNYVEFSFSEDSITVWSEPFGYIEMSYVSVKDSITLYSKDNTVTKNKIKQINDKKIELELIYWEVPASSVDTIFEKVNHTLYRIDDNEFTRDEVKIPNFDTIQKRLISVDFHKFEEAFRIRMIEYKRKLNK